MSTTIVKQKSSVLTDPQVIENRQNAHAASPVSVGDSQTLNTCSFPNNEAITSENHIFENINFDTYEARSEQCGEDLRTMTGKALNIRYKREAKTRSNCKYRTKNMTGITGPVWDPVLDTISGFLREVGPIPALDYSLDRIDPNFGYVAGNLRWADKKLQSENRGNAHVFDVRGIPLTMSQFASFLCITPDALRMKMNRGKTVEDILAEYLTDAPKAAKKPKKSIAEWPWPPGKEEAWEERFQKHCPESKWGHLYARVEFFIETSTEALNPFYERWEYYAENLIPNKDIPAEWLKKWTFWIDMIKFAKEQKERVMSEEQAKRLYIGPTQSDLDAVNLDFGNDQDEEEEDEDGEEHAYDYYQTPNYGPYEGDL